MADITSKPATDAYRDGWERCFGEAARTEARERFWKRVEEASRAPDPLLASIELLLEGPREGR